MDAGVVGADMEEGVATGRVGTEEMVGAEGRAIGGAGNCLVCVTIGLGGRGSTYGIILATPLGSNLTRKYAFFERS